METFDTNTTRKIERLEREIALLNVMLKQHNYKTQFEIKPIKTE